MTVNAIASVEHSPPQLPEEDDKNVIPFTPSCSIVELKEAFTQELTLHHRGLLIYARSILFDKEQAHDLVQEACLSAWEKFNTYDQTRADFGTWMRGFVRNKIRDWVKSKKGGSRPEVSIENDHLDFLEAEFSTPGQKPSFSLLKGCLQKLPDNLKDPIQLTYYMGHKGEEASQKLGINPATLRKRLSRARLALHDCMAAL